MRRRFSYLLLPAFIFLIAQHPNADLQKEARENVRKAFRNSLSEDARRTLSSAELRDLDRMTGLLSEKQQAGALSELRNLEERYKGYPDAMKELARGYHAVALSLYEDKRMKESRDVALKAYALAKESPRSAEMSLINSLLKQLPPGERDGRASAEDNETPAAKLSPIDASVDSVITGMSASETAGQVLSEAAGTRDGKVDLRLLRRAGIDIQVVRDHLVQGDYADVEEFGRGRFRIKVKESVFKGNLKASPTAIKALFTEKLDNAAYTRDTHPGFFSKIYRDVRGKVKGIWVAVEINTSEGRGFYLRPVTDLAKHTNFLITLWKNELPKAIHENKVTPSDIGKTNFDNIRRSRQSELGGWKGVLGIHNYVAQRYLVEMNPAEAFSIPKAKELHKELLQEDQKFQERNRLKVNNR